MGENNKNDKIRVIWEVKMKGFSKELNLYELKKAVENSFSKASVSDSYKQKLVYDLLEAVKNKDQNRFFYLLLKSINRPKENFGELLKKIKKCYDILPEEVFVNFAYSIIIGIMATYNKSNKEEEIKEEK